MCNVSLNGTHPTDASLRVLRALEAAGLEAWYVGGWVRDALMGCPSHYVDMCCSGQSGARGRWYRGRGVGH